MPEVNHFYVEQNAAFTTTSATWVDVTGATVLSSTLAANTKYLLIARATHIAASTTSHGYLRVQTDDDVDVTLKSENRMEYANTSVVDGYLFVHSFSTDAAPADMKFQAKVDGGVTMTVDQVSVLLIDLDDLGAANYFESIHTATGLKVADDPAVTDLATIAAANLGTSEEWLLLGSARVGVEATSSSFQVRLHGAADAAIQSVLTKMQEEGEDSLETRVYGLMARHKAVTTAVDAKMSMSMEPYLYGDTTDEGGYLIALKASAFADFQWSYEPGPITVGYLPTDPPTNVATVGPYTPSVGGNHLILSSVQNNINFDIRRCGSWMLDGTAALRAGDRVISTQLWDGTDLSLMTTAQRVSQSTSKTYHVVAADQLGASPAVGQGWLFILNLNVAATTQIVTVGTATETDAPQPVSASKPIVVTVAQTSQTDAARPVSPVKPITSPLGAVVETDTAQAATPVKPVIVTATYASETEAAIAATVLQSNVLPIGTVTEIGSAQPLSPLKPIVVVVAYVSESETGQTIAVVYGTFAVRWREGSVETQTTGAAIVAAHMSGGLSATYAEGDIA